MQNELFTRIAAAKVGDTITIADQTFTRQPLTLPAQVALTKILLGALEDGDATTMAGALINLFDRLLSAVSTILADYDPTFDREWLYGLTSADVSLVDMLDLAVGQVVIDRNTAIIQSFGGLANAMALSQVLGQHAEAVGQ